MCKNTTRLFIPLLGAILMVLLLYVCFVIPSPSIAANHSSQSWQSQLQYPYVNTYFYTVRTTDDENDSICTPTSSDCSLREAIITANSDGGWSNINFDITGGCASVCTIEVNPTASGLGPLPTLSGVYGTTINGYSQSGASEATSSSPATIKIELDGTNVTGFNGLNITSDNNEISGLAINRFGLVGISIYGGNNNTISGNYIGTNYQGTSASPNGGGVYLGNFAYDNTIGGDLPEDRNIISGNWLNGVSIGYYLTTDHTASANVIKGNYIGTDASGTSRVGNGLDGIYIHKGSNNNQVIDNLISGNYLDGVYIHDAEYNFVQGNYIGVDINGSVDLGNSWHGVRIDGGSVHNYIGGYSPTVRNIISGNGPGGTNVYNSGVLISGSDTMSNTVYGNYIGISASGTISIPNEYYGVFIHSGSKYNLIGGSAATDGNVISGNNWEGINIVGIGTDYNIIAGNYIGIDPSGTYAMQNGHSGINILEGVKYCQVGGDTANARNVISGNDDYGIMISSGSTMSNTVSGNYIGTDASGTSDIPNGLDGINLYNGTKYNLIGGNTPGERNIISGNDFSGIRISSNDTMSNTVIGNYIGTDHLGTSRLRNGENGVGITDGAQHNKIGDLGEGEANVLSGNSLYGVFIIDTDTSYNFVRGNFIGTDSSGTLDVHNSAGVNIYNSASQNIIGPGNIIAFNNISGIVVQTESTLGNQITQNSIYSNGSMGIDIQDSAHGNISPPSIASTSWGSIEINGSACPNCRVEVFTSPDDDGEGKHFIGDDVADGSGNFSVTVSHLLYPYLTATSTDVYSGTSEFSGVFESEITSYLSIFLPVIIR